MIVLVFPQTNQKTKCPQDKTQAYLFLTFIKFTFDDRVHKL